MPCGFCGWLCGSVCLAGGFWSGGIVENRGEQSLGMAIPVPQGVKGGTGKIPITLATVQFQVAKTKAQNLWHVSQLFTNSALWGRKT